jgi:hypothetical protein
MSAGRFSTNDDGNRTTDPVISRTADERLVLLQPELSGNLFLNIWFGFSRPRYLNIAAATDLSFHKAHVCGEVFN